MRLFKTNVNARVLLPKRSQGNDRMILQCKASSIVKKETKCFLFLQFRSYNDNVKINY